MNNNLLFLLPLFMNGSGDFGKLLPELMKGDMDPIMLLCLSMMSKNKPDGQQNNGMDLQRLLQMFSSLNKKKEENPENQ